jgi:hypothetical protein
MTHARSTVWLAALVALGTAACDEPSDDAPSNMPPVGGTTGGEGTTFNHDNSAVNVYDYVDRLSKEGPVSFTSHMHGCFKLRYSTLGTVLTSLGVDLTRTTYPSAGALYRDSAAALGAPDLANGVRENRAITTAAAARMFDIFLAAADEIVSGLPSLQRCKVGGMGVQLFDSDDRCLTEGVACCLADGVSCLIGVSAQPAHVVQCTETVHGATSLANGKQIAVAVLLAAAYTCE